MSISLATHLPTKIDPGLYDIAPEDGLMFPMPPSHPQESRFLEVTESINGMGKASVGFLENVMEGGEKFHAFETLRRGRGLALAEASMRVGIMVKATVLKFVFQMGLAIANNPKDRLALKKADALVDIASNCGGAAVTAIAGFGTGGILWVATAFQAVGCVKSTVDYFSMDEHGQTWFERNGRGLEMTLETVSFIGAALGGGVRAGWKTLSKLKKSGLVLEATGIIVKGVKYTAAAIGDILTPIPATSDRVDQMLSEAGLRKSLCFFPWPWQTQSMLGSCSPWGD